MQVQVNTDHNIDGHAALTAHVNGVVESALNHISEHITRVEVHLTDDIGQSSDHKTHKKAGKNDKRCVMEARLEGRQPVAVTHHAATMHQAVEGAAEKLNRTLERTLGRLRDQKRVAHDASPEGSALTEE